MARPTACCLSVISVRPAGQYYTVLESYGGRWVDVCVGLVRVVSLCV